MEKQVNSRSKDKANFPQITQSETTLANYKDFILYGFNDFNDPDNLSGFAYSSDLGKTWHDGGALPQNPGGVNEGDPVTAADRHGVFYYGQLSTEIIDGEPESVISVSTGKFKGKKIKMNPPQIVGRGQDRTSDGIQDKPWIAVGPDANNHGHEALYIAWTDFTAPSGTNIRFSKYTTGVRIDPIIQNLDIVVGDTKGVVGTFVVVDKRGAIYVFYEEIDLENGGEDALDVPNRVIRMTKSTDGGKTFPINVPVSTAFSGAANQVGPCQRPSISTELARQIRMNEFPHAAIGPDGTLYAVWNAGRFDGIRTFIDVFLAYSIDKGLNWQEVRITNTLSFPFFPSVAANDKGAHIQYNRFNDPHKIGYTGDGTFGIFMKTFSLKSGLNHEKKISNPHSRVPITHPNVDNHVADCYMGDYNQVIAGPDGYLLHAWGDNRNILRGQLNPDVFFKRTKSSSH